MLLPSKEKKVLIVGAGLAGATIARVLAENSILVKVIDKRSHIAGNAYDFINENNERIHKDGPHLLHCNKNSRALSFLTRFTKWLKYEHKVRALLKDGRTTPLPINQTTIEDIYNIKFENEKEVRIFLDSIRNINLIPKNTDELFESAVGNKLADIFLRPYTKKMWGLSPSELEISIGARLPVRVDKNDKYFNDNFQALPKDGYTNMIKNILDHENINIELNTSFEEKLMNDFDHSFLCIPIDKYFNFSDGVLPYRSIIFENRMENVDKNSVPVINFTDDSPYTRKTIWSSLPNSPKNSRREKTITYEKPCSMELNPNEYYYPVITSSSKEIFKKYIIRAKSLKNITFCGRTGLFRYLDMVPAVELHLKMAKDFLKKII